MAECNPDLPRFAGWTCADRNGRSNEQAAAAAAALGFGDGGAAILGSGGGGAGAAGTVMRGILGDDLAALGERSLGLQSKDFFLLFLTLAGGLACCALYVAARLGRAACQGSARRRLARKRRLASVRPRSARGGARPMRLAAEEEEHLEGEEWDDEILGDDE